MGIESFFIMRHEILLVIIAVLILLFEIFRSKESATAINALTIILFAINCVIGFLPAKTGELFGGMYQTSAVQILMKNVLNIGVFIVMLQSARWLNHEENRYKAAEFYLLLVATLTGMNFMISSGDFLMLFIGLETATIPMAALAAYDVYRNDSAEAGIKLILSSALSSGIMLFGISLIYGSTGSIYFSEVVSHISNIPIHALALIFFFAGMAFKISLVPFHLWTADVYEGSPVNVTSYLSVISKGAAVFILMIVLFTVFRTIAPLWKDLIWVISVATMTIANLFAIRQNNLKRFLAFSSISQAGFILLGIIGGNQLGMASVIYFVLIYIFSNLGAFGVVSAIFAQTGKELISDYDGLYKTNPKLSLLMLLSLFSLAGIPPVAGFFGKFFLFIAAAKSGFYILVLIALLNTIISLYYYLLVVKAMFMNQNDTPIPYFKSDFTTRLALIICIAGIFVTGFMSGWFEKISGLSFGL